jgi:CRISPR-associated protein Cas2
MARRRYLIAYDIADHRRLRRVIKVMESYGERLQYSVFLCDLSSLEFSRWRSDLMPELNLAWDSVVCIDLGAVGASAPMQVYGMPRHLPPTGPIVV